MEMHLLNLLPGFAVAAVVAWALVAVWIRFSLRAKILDVPNARSSHVKVTPRGGGVGIVVVVLAGLLAGVWGVGIGREGGGLTGSNIGWFAALGAGIAVVSFIDDVRSLPSVLRLVIQLAAAGAAVAVLGSFRTVTLPFLGVIVPPHALMVALTVVWIVGLTNVYNFMDGIDGIAGGQGLVAGLAWAWFGHVHGLPVVGWTGTMVAAACTGFLVHNWAPAKVFMGDVGSAFLGFVLALLPLMAVGSMGDGLEGLRFDGAVMVFAGLVVWPFIGDGVFTFLRRLKHRENVLKAHRSHLYQRLTIAGWPHAPVSRIYIWWAVVMAVLGGAYLEGGDAARTLALVMALVSVLGMFAFVKRMERHPPPRPQVPNNQQPITNNQ